MNNYYDIMIQMESYFSTLLYEESSIYDTTFEDILEESNKLSQSIEAKLKSSKKILSKYKDAALACNPIGLTVKTSIESLKKRYNAVIKHWEDALKYFKAQQNKAKSEGNQYDWKNQLYKKYYQYVAEERKIIKSTKINSEKINVTKPLIKEACDWLKNDFGVMYRYDQRYAKNASYNDIEIYGKFASTDNYNVRRVMDYINRVETLIMSIQHMYAPKFFNEYKKIIVAAANYNPRKIKESNQLIEEAFIIDGVYDYYDLMV